MVRPHSGLAPQEQYPYVNIFKLPTFDPERKLAVKGDVRQLTDPGLHRRVWSLRGDIPSNNSLTFPKDSHDGLALTGRFVYAFLKGTPGKSAYFFLECVTDSGPTVRVTFSNAFADLQAGATQLKIPLPEVSVRWAVLAIDMVELFKTQYRRQQFRHVKSLTISSCLSVRGVITSPLVYTPDTLPYEVSYPLDRTATCGAPQWADLYDFYWVGTQGPAPQDSAPRAARRALEESRKKSYDQYAGGTPAGSVAGGSVHNSLLTAHDADEAAALVTTVAPVHALHVNGRTPIVVGRGATVMYASGKAIVSHDSDTNEQAFLRGHSAPVTGLCTDYNRRVLASTQSTPPALYTWDLHAPLTTRDAGRPGGATHAGRFNLAAHMSEVTHACMSGSGTAVFVCGKPLRASAAAAAAAGDAAAAGCDRSLLLAGAPSPYSGTPLGASAAAAPPASSGAPPLSKNKKHVLVYMIVDVSNLKRPTLSLKQTFDTNVVQACFVPKEEEKFVTCDGSPTLRYMRVKNNSMRACAVTAGTLLVNHGCQVHFISVGFESTHVATPNQRTLLYTGTKEGFAVVFDYQQVGSNPLFCVKCHDGPMRCVVPAGGLCVTGGDDGYLRVWPLDWSQFHIETCLDSPVLQVDVSRDALFMAMLNKDLCVSVLDFQTRELRPVLHAHTQAVTAVLFHPSPDRNVFATASADCTVRIWDATTFLCISRYDTAALRRSVESDARSLLTSRGAPPMESVATANQSLPLLSTTLGPSASAAAAALEALGAGASMTAAQSAAQHKENTGTPLCMDWSRDLNAGVLAVGFTGGVVRVFDIDHRCLLLCYQSHAEDVGCLRYTRNGKWLVSLDAYQLCFSDVRHGYHTSRVSRFMSPIAQPSSLTESADGAYLALIGCDDTTIQLYEAAQGYEVGVVRGAEADISAGTLTSLAFVQMQEATGDPEDAAASPPTSSAPQLFSALAAGTSDGHFVLYRLPAAVPDPPLPDDLDYGVSAPALDVVKLLATRCQAGVRHTVPSPRGEWVAVSMSGATDDLFGARGGFFVSTLACDALRRDTGNRPPPHGAPPLTMRESKVYVFDHCTDVASLAWSPDGTRLVSCDASGVLLVSCFDAERYNPQAATASRRRLLRQQRAASPQPSSRPCWSPSPATSRAASLPQSSTSAAASPHAETPAEPTGPPPLPTLPPPTPPPPPPCRAFPSERVAGGVGFRDVSKYAVDTQAEGLTPSGVFSLNSSTVDAVACGNGERGGATLVTCTGGVLSVSEEPDPGCSLGDAPALKLLLNDGFVSCMTVSPDRTLLAAALVYTGGSGEKKRAAAAMQSRLVVWDLQTYAFCASLPLSEATPVVQCLAWWTDEGRTIRRTSPAAGGDRVSHSEGVVCVVGSQEAGLLRYTYRHDGLAGHFDGAFVHSEQAARGEELLHACAVQPSDSAEVAPRFCVATTTRLFSLAGTQQQSPVAAASTGTAHAGLQCVAEADPHGPQCPEGFVWGGCRDGTLCLFATAGGDGDGGGAPRLLHSDVALCAGACVSGVSSVGDLLFVCLRPAEEGGGSAGSPLMKIARVTMTGAAAAPRVELEVLTTIDNASGDPGNTLRRCTPVAAAASSGQDELYESAAATTVLASTENGNVLCVTYEESSLDATGDLEHDAADGVGGGTPRCTVEYVRENCTFGEGERPVHVKTGYMGDLVVVGSERKLGLWDLRTTHFLASGFSVSPVLDVLLHEAFGVFAAEADGCLAVLSYDPAAKALVQKHRYQLAAQPLQSLAFLRGSCDVEGVVVSDRHGGVYGYAVADTSAAAVLCEPLPDRDHEATFVRTAAQAGGVVLHSSLKFGTLSLLEEADGGRYAVTASVVPRRGYTDAQLTADGTQVVYLSGNVLVVYDRASQKEVREIPLQATFTSFLMSPDMVYCFLMSATSPRIGVCDYQYSVVQDIEGHITPLTALALTSDGTAMVSLSGTSSDYELLRWDVRQLAQ